MSPREGTVRQSPRARATGRRLLFVSGECDGGAPRSTLELARRLVPRYDVSVVLGDRSAASATYGRLTKGAVKLGRLGDLTAGRVAQRLGTNGQTATDRGVRIVRTAVAANRARREIADWEPDAVIANSLPRVEMRWLLEHARARGIPFVVYVREDHAVTHFSVSGLCPDLALANSQTLTDQISPYQACTCVPSVVDTSGIRVEPTREVVVSVNPALDASALDVARHCPEIDFVLQESWQMEPRFERELLEAVDALPNARFRRAVPGPNELFADARLLLITAQAGRPRIVVEAHACGIPVVAPALPPMLEVVGDGGLLFPPASTPAEIATVVRQACRASRYESLCQAARSLSMSADRDPDAIAMRFDDALVGALWANSR